MTKLGLLLIALMTSSGQAHAVPSWGAPTSSSANTSPAALKPGQWVWGGDSKAMGPMAVVVSITEQRAYVYRNGLLEAVSTVSTGKPGHETPTGVFTILQKDKDHHSSKYNDAAMPYQERLTWDGIALHAGGLPGYPESHGCVHLPTEFARLLFGATNMGMVVVIAKDGVSDPGLVHPLVASPIDPGTGKEVLDVPLGTQEQYRWQPEAAPTGVVSLLLSTSDRRLFAYRDGKEIGRSRVDFRNGAAPAGTRAYMVANSKVAAGEPSWVEVGIPGEEAAGGTALSQADEQRVLLPDGFRAALKPILQPGVVLLVTDQHVLPETTGPALQVLNAEQPAL
ncbi:L,D-transpeptidase [Stenotrophomonas bentonitica]